MKNSNEKIYMTSPIAIMASVVAASENSVNPNYQAEAEHIVECYSDLNNNAKVVVCETPYMEMMKEEDQLILLNFIHAEFGKIHSFTVHKFNSETSVYKLYAVKGFFKMILVLNSENQVSAIDFSKEEISEIRLAA